MSWVSPTPPFVGRELELEEALAALALPQQSAGPHLHVSGTFGIGKTAFVKKLLARRLDAFPSERHLWAGRAPDVPSRAASIVSQILRGQEVQGVAPSSTWVTDPSASVEMYFQFLRDGNYVVVFDDVTDPNEVGPLVRVPQSCAVITVGRFGWPTRGPTEIVLGPLNTSDAARLARELISDDNGVDEPASRALLNAAHGEPLVLRLLADLIRREGVRSALRVWESELSRQAHAHDDAPTLRSALVSGYDALSLSARRALRALGLAASSIVTVESLANVLGVDAPIAAQSLHELEAAGFLRQDEQGFTPPDVVRQFALERLNADGSADEIDAALLTADLEAVQEYAVRRARTTGNETAEVMALMSLARSYTRLRHFEDAEAALRAALGVVAVLRLDRLEAVIYRDLARVYSTLKEHDKADESMTRALALLSKRGDTRALAQLWSERGRVLTRAGRLVEAEEAFRKAIALAVKVQDRELHAITLRLLAQCVGRRGSSKEALKLLHQGLSEQEQLGLHREQALSLLVAGSLLASMSTEQSPRPHFERALSLFRSIGDWRGEARALVKLGASVAHEGSPDAAGLLERAIELFERDNDRVGKAEALTHLGHVQMTLGQWLQAERSLETALALYREESDQKAAASVLYELANVYRAMGDREEAENALRASTQLGANVETGKTASARDEPIA